MFTFQLQDFVCRTSRETFHMEVEGKGAQFFVTLIISFVCKVRTDEMCPVVGQRFGFWTFRNKEVDESMSTRAKLQIVTCGGTNGRHPKQQFSRTESISRCSLEQSAAKIERVGDGNQAPVFVLRQQHSDGRRQAKEAGTMRSFAPSDQLTDWLTERLTDWLSQSETDWWLPQPKQSKDAAVWTSLLWLMPPVSMSPAGVQELYVGFLLSDHCKYSHCSPPLPRLWLQKAAATEAAEAQAPYGANNVG